MFEIIHFDVWYNNNLCQLDNQSTYNRFLRYIKLLIAYSLGAADGLTSPYYIFLEIVIANRIRPTEYDKKIG